MLKIRWQADHTLVYTPKREVLSGADLLSIQKLLVMTRYPYWHQQQLVLKFNNQIIFI
jgi:hypothetical protein